MKSVKKIIILGLFPTLLLSCNKEVEDKTPVSNQSVSFTQMKQAMNTLGGTKWVFVNYKINKIPQQYENKISLEFANIEADKIRYSGGNFINRYMGTLLVNEGKTTMKTSGSASTMMAGDEILMDLEYKYLINFDKATAFEIVGKELFVYLGDKNDTKTEVMLFGLGE